MKKILILIIFCFSVINLLAQNTEPTAINLNWNGAIPFDINNSQ